MTFLDFKPFYEHQNHIYGLDKFTPSIVDIDYLKDLGVSVVPSQDCLDLLSRGSAFFIDGFNKHSLVPTGKLYVDDIDIEKIQTEIHNYTGRCPTLTYEFNPVKGCTVGCLYCLVSDGVHQVSQQAYSNYHLYVRKLLEEKNGRDSSNQNHYYYFSPKTEAFQESTLLTGIAHRILREFIDHFKRNPSSKARLFIASKAGVKHLLCENEGESVIDLFKQLNGKMQFNTSVSIMPKALRDVLEPFAAPIEERLKAVELCQKNNIQANSALVQPIFTPCLTDELIEDFFKKLHNSGIINYKPEFLTASMENVAMLGQLLGYFDKSMERTLYDHYLTPSNANHRKQRGRTAPNRELCVNYLNKIMNYTQSLGMSISICYWVRKQLGIDETMIPIINRNGFQCLGYQSELFKNV